MASSLAAQLNALAKQQKKPAAPGGKAPIRGKASLLFDYQAASDIDVITIHKIGCEGEPCGRLHGFGPGGGGWRLSGAGTWPRCRVVPPHSCHHAHHRCGLPF